MTLRYSELSPEMVAVLRIERALETAYPQNGNKASLILQGYEAFRKRSGVIPGPVVPFGGVG